MWNGRIMMSDELKGCRRKFLCRIWKYKGARGNVVGWSTALLVAMVSWEFFINIILPAALWSGFAILCGLWGKYKCVELYVHCNLAHSYISVWAVGQIELCWSVCASWAVALLSSVLMLFHHKCLFFRVTACCSFAFLSVTKLHFFRIVNAGAIHALDFVHCPLLEIRT